MAGNQEYEHLRNALDDLKRNGYAPCNCYSGTLSTLGRIGNPQGACFCVMRYGMITGSFMPQIIDSVVSSESQLGQLFIETLMDLKYAHHPDLHGRVSLRQNIRDKFEALNCVHLTDCKFALLLSEIASPEILLLSKRLDLTNLRYGVA